MATQTRAPTEIEYYPRRYHQVDPVPNLTARFALSTPPFTTRLTEPDYTLRARPVQDFIWEPATTLGIPALSVTAIQFRAPTFVQYYRKPYLQVDQQSTSLALSVPISTKPPFVAPSFAEVYRRADRDFLQMETLSYLPGPIIAPYIPVDFPTPMRARATPQDFFFSSTGIQPLAPFNQDDWPEIYRRKYFHQSFEWSGITTRGIPSGINAPFSYSDWITPIRARQVPHESPPNVTILNPPQPFPFFLTDWPNPLRAKERPGESYASPQILLTTVVARPFAQTDWPPLPVRKPMYPSADFGWEAWTTLYRPLPPPGALVMPNLLGENVYEAMKLLQAAGIYVPNTSYFAQFSTIMVKWDRSSVYPGGTVMAQSVPPGNLAFKGEPVILTIAVFPFASLIDIPPDWKQ